MTVAALVTVERVVFVCAALVGAAAAVEVIGDELVGVKVSIVAVGVTTDVVALVRFEVVCWVVLCVTVPAVSSMGLKLLCVAVTGVVVTSDV